MWVLFDSVVIVASIVLAIFDIVLSDERFSTISRVLRGILRFMRIFLLFRKVNQFKKKISTSKSLKTPFEAVLEILSGVKTTISEKKFITDVDWCIDIISTNKLYVPIFDKEQDKQKLDQVILLLNERSTIG